MAADCTVCLWWCLLLCTRLVRSVATWNSVHPPTHTFSRSRHTGTPDWETSAPIESSSSTSRFIHRCSRLLLRASNSAPFDWQSYFMADKATGSFAKELLVDFKLAISEVSWAAVSDADFFAGSSSTTLNFISSTRDCTSEVLKCGCLVLALFTEEQLPTCECLSPPLIRWRHVPTFNCLSVENDGA